MTWVLIVAFFANGQPNFAEPRAFVSESACLSALTDNYNAYEADGISTNFISGRCVQLVAGVK